MEIKPRTINIYEIQLLEINESQKQINFRVACSKGTYIRSLCEDIAKKLNTIGYMSALNRTQVGQFTINQAITIEQMEEQNITYLTVEELFHNKEAICLEEKRLQPFLNGVKLTMKKPDGVYRIYDKKNFIGIGIVSDELLKRDIILKE